MISKERIASALQHAKEILHYREQFLTCGPGYALSYHMAKSNIKEVEDGKCSEELISHLEDMERYRNEPVV